MANRICIDYLSEMIDMDASESLSHHGVDGMSWGNRNGPPYPLGGVNKKVARAEAKMKKKKEKQMARLQKAAKKARKAKAKAAKKEAKELEREEKIFMKKQKLISKGNYKQIVKNRKLFTAAEFRELKAAHDAEVDAKINRFMNKAANLATTIGSIANMSYSISAMKGYKQDRTLKDLDIESKKIKNSKDRVDLNVSQQAFEWAKEDRETDRKLQQQKLINEYINTEKAKASALSERAKAADQAMSTMSRILDYEATRKVRIQNLPGGNMDWFNTRPYEWKPFTRSTIQGWKDTPIYPGGAQGQKKR